MIFFRKAVHRQKKSFFRNQNSFAAVGDQRKALCWRALWSEMVLFELAVAALWALASIANRPPPPPPPTPTVLPMVLGGIGG